MPFADFRQVAKGISSLFPEEIQQINAKIDEYARGIVTGGTLFEELGSTTSAPSTATTWTTWCRSSKT